MQLTCPVCQYQAWFDDRAVIALPSPEDANITCPSCHGTFQLESRKPTSHVWPAREIHTHLRGNMATRGNFTVVLTDGTRIESVTSLRHPDGNPAFLGLAGRLPDGTAYGECRLRITTDIRHIIVQEES